MDLKRLRAVRDQVTAARGQLIVRNGEQIPLGVALLEEELAREQDIPSRFDLYQLMRQEWFEVGRPERELSTLRRCASDIHDEPLPLIVLAEALKDDPSVATEAAQIAEDAVCKARSTNRFVRHALAVQARVAARYGNFGLLSQILESLIRDAGVARVEDGPYDVDFLERLPRDAVSADLIRRYLMVARPPSAG